jgi:hypothetical protein
MFYRMDNGTAGATVSQNILLRTLASFPNVSEIVVWLDGSEHMHSHVRYDGVFVVNGDLLADIEFVPSER